MATRLRTTDSVVAAAGYTIPPNAIVATTCVTLFATDRWMAVKVGTGAI